MKSKTNNGSLYIKPNIKIPVVLSLNYHQICPPKDDSKSESLENTESNQTYTVKAKLIGISLNILILKLETNLIFNFGRPR